MYRTTTLDIAESSDPKRRLELSIELESLPLSTPSSSRAGLTTLEPDSSAIASSVAPAHAHHHAAAEPETTERFSPSPEPEAVPPLPEADIPPNGGRSAWTMVAGCAMISFWFTGINYSWGVIQAALVDRHLAPASTLAFVGSLAVAVLSVLGMVNTRLLRSVGARSMALASVAFMSLSQITASFTTRNVGGLFATAGVMMGIGTSLAFIVVSVVPAGYFSTRKGTAVGVVYCGGGLGGAVLSLAMEAGVRRLGVEWTFRLLGILMAACCLPAAWVMKERTTAQKKMLIDWSLLKSPDFLFLFLAGAIATFPLFVPPFFLPMYAQSLGLSPSVGALLVCLFNFSSALSRILTGLLSDRLTGPLNALFLTLALTALTLLVMWPTSTGLGELIAFVLLNGAGNGGFFAIMPTVTAQVLGSWRMGTAFGMLVTGWGGGYLMGAPIAGYLLAACGGQDAGISAFRPAMFWAGGMAAGAAGITAGLRLRKSTDLAKKM